MYTTLRFSDPTNFCASENKCDNVRGNTAIKGVRESIMYDESEIIIFEKYNVEKGFVRNKS